MNRRRANAGATTTAIEAVYRERYRDFVRLAVAMVGDDEKAHDAVQEAFARAIRAHESFRGEGPLDAWLWGTLVNVCRNARRTSPNGRPVRVESDAPEGEHRVDYDDIRNAIRALPERQRTVLFLRHYGDLTYDQIANALSIRRGTVAATLHDAHHALHKMLLEVRT